MDANVIKELQNGLNAAYINGSVAVNLAYIFNVIFFICRGRIVAL